MIGLALWGSDWVRGYPLAPEQELHLRATVPRLFEKMNSPGNPSDRDPLVVVALGDSVTEYYHHDESMYDSLDAYVGRMLEKLTREFFYSGGVRLLKARTDGLPEKHDDYRGPEIILQNHARGGAHSLHAIRHLTTEAFLYDPALVMINMGINDALSQTPLVAFQKAIRSAVDICEEKETDLLLFGCTPVMSGGGPLGMGMTRSRVAATGEIAAERGVPFIDLGQGFVSGVVARTGTTPEERFADVAVQLKAYYVSEGGVDDGVHPNVPGHEKLGRYAYEAFMGEAPGLSYGALEGACRQTGETGYELTFELENRSGEAREANLCALEGMGILTPLEPYREVSLEAGEKKAITVRYEMREADRVLEGAKFEKLPGEQAHYWFPFLVTDQRGTEFVDVRAVVEPVVMIWETGLTDGVSKEITLGGEVYNTGDKAIQGEYTATWRDQEVTGRVAVGPGEKAPVQLVFPIPVDADQVRMRDPLRMVLRVGGKEYVFEREVEVKRNLHLGKRVSMALVDSFLTGARAEEKGTMDGRVTFRAEADENALYLLFDIPAEVELFGGPDTGPGVVVDIMIDGRSYDYLEERSWGRRRDFGFVAALRVGVPPTDGPGDVMGFGQASFGNGYSRKLDQDQITSVLETRSSGERRVTITIPRVYFYHHEWQLGNVNSLLGIDAVIVFPGGESGAGRAFGLSRSVLHRSYAPRLAVLELSPEGTGRWSVNFN
ncbi:MAG: SGNH/GDSL hydrolase family protein [Verrucomicrobiota bacterium]